MRVKAPRTLYLPRVYLTSSLHQNLTHSGAGSLVLPGVGGWQAGLSGRGGRVGARVCMHLGWGESAGAGGGSQGARHTEPEHFPADVRQPWVLQSVGRVEVCLAGRLLWARSSCHGSSVGHPDNRINTCPLEGVFSEGLLRSTPTANQAPAAQPHREASLNSASLS